MSGDEPARGSAAARRLDTLLVLGAFSLAFLYSLRRIGDSDLWHHLRCGEYLHRTGAILRTIHFDARATDRPFLNHEWLFQAVIYPLERWGGEPALMALQIGLVLAAVAVLYRTLRLHSADRGVIAFVLALGVIASQHRFSLRPQHFSYVFLAALLHWLHLFQRGRRSWAWGIPVLMLLCVNVHAECLWALAIPAAFAAADAGRRLWHRDRPDVGRLGLVVALTAAASLLNPFGWRTVVWPLLVMREMRGGVEELLPSTSPRFAFFWIYCLVLLLAAAWRPRRVDPTWGALSLVFGAVAWSANRGIPHFFFVSAPVMVACLDEGLRGLRAPRRLAAAARAALLVAMAGLGLAVVRSPAYLRPYDGVAYPEVAVRFLRLQGVTGGVFNEHVWGGFLLWKGYPGLRPFIDGRFYARADFEEFARLRAGAPGWPATFDRDAVSVAILKYSPPGRTTLNDALFASPNWAVVYWDDESLVYLRSGPGREALVSRAGSRLVNPDRQLLFQYEGVPPALVREALRLSEANLAFAPGSYRAHIMAGNACLALGSFAAAAQRYESALARLDPPNAWIFYQLARCYRELGDRGRAEASLVRCLALAPESEEGRRLLEEIRRAGRP